MKYPASHLTPFPPTFPGKTTCKRILSAKNSARAPAIPLSTFRMNTCKSVSKQRTLSPFRMNTYAKTRGRGVLLLTVRAQSRCRGRALARPASARCGVTPPLHGIQGKPPKSFPSYYIPASQALSCSYALFCATGFLHPSCFQYLAHSFNGSCEESLYERGATESGVIVFAGWDVFREFALDRCCCSGGRRVRSELGEADPLL